MPTTRSVSTRQPASVRRFVAKWIIGLAMEALAIWVYFHTGPWISGGLVKLLSILVMPYYLVLGTWNWLGGRRERRARD